MINNRQNGRRRGRGGGAGGAPRPNGGNGGGTDRGNRIDNRARGNAAQLHEKYKALARDSQMQGDRVTTEYYLQFADHYFRVLAESRSRFEEQQPRPRRDDYMSQNDGDEDYGDEGEMTGNGQDRPQQHDDQQQDRSYQSRDDDQRRYGNEGGNGNGNGNAYNEDNRGDRDRGDRRPQQRRDRTNNEGYEAQAPRNEARSDAGRGENRTDDRGNNERPQRDDRNRRPRRDRDEGHAPVAAERAPEPAPMLIPEAVPVAAQQEAAPVRTRRPRRTAAEMAAAAEAERIEVDRLPPAFSLTAPPSDVANDADAPAEKPRRRPRRAAASDGAVVES